MNTRHDPALAGRLYARDVVADLHSMADGLYAACIELARVPTCASCDNLLSSLKAAEHSVTRMRVRLAGEVDT